MNVGLDRIEWDAVVEQLATRGWARLERAADPELCAGIEVVKKVAIARDAAINDRLGAIPPSERAAFHATLFSIVGATDAV